MKQLTNVDSSTYTTKRGVELLREQFTKQSSDNAEKATLIQTLRQSNTMREQEIFRVENQELGQRQETQKALKKQFEDTLYGIRVLKQEKSELDTEISGLVKQKYVLNEEKDVQIKKNEDLTSQSRVLKE